MPLFIHTSINTPHISFFIHYFSMYCKCNRRLNPRSSPAYLLCISNLVLLLCFAYCNMSMPLRDVVVQNLKSDLADLPIIYQMCNGIYPGDKATAAWC